MKRITEEDSVRFRGISDNERSPSTATEAVTTTIFYCNVSVRTWTKVGIVFSLLDQLLIGAFCVYFLSEDGDSWERMKWETIVWLTAVCACALSLVFPIFAWQGVRKGSNCLLTVWLILLFLLIGLYLAGLAWTAYVFYTNYGNPSFSSPPFLALTPDSFWTCLISFLWFLFVLTLRIFFLVVTIEFRREVRRKMENEEEEEMEEKHSTVFYSQCPSPYPVEDLELQQQNHGQQQPQYQHQYPYQFQQQQQHQQPPFHNPHPYHYQDGLHEPRAYFPHKNSIFLYR